MVSSLAFGVYTAVGIDDLTEYYIGYFYWSAPLVTVLVIVLAGLEAVRVRPGAEGSRFALGLGTGVAVLAAAAAFVVLAVIPGTRTSTNDIDEALPQVVATLAARAQARRSCCTSTTQPGLRPLASWCRRSAPGSRPAWTIRGTRS